MGLHWVCFSFSLCCADGLPVCLALRPLGWVGETFTGHNRHPKCPSICKLDHNQCHVWEMSNCEWNICSFLQVTNNQTKSNGRREQGGAASLLARGKGRRYAVSLHVEFSCQNADLRRSCKLSVHRLAWCIQIGRTELKRDLQSLSLKRERTHLPLLVRVCVGSKSSISIWIGMKWAAAATRDQHLLLSRNYSFRLPQRWRCLWIQLQIKGVVIFKA